MATKQSAALVRRPTIASAIRIFHNFAKTLRLHAYGILAYYDDAISTGPLEGTNNKIKTMVSVHGP